MADNFAGAEPGMSFNVGQYVKFGRYPQNNGDILEPIEWLVLENNGDSALLLSKYALDCQQFHHDDYCVSWWNCDLRNWLNHDFLNLAFNKEEQQSIVNSIVYTDSDPKYNGMKVQFHAASDEVFVSHKGFNFVFMKAHKETVDKVFCLSIQEVYCVPRDKVLCQLTPYALSHGSDLKGKCTYWLRTLNAEGYGVTCVYDLLETNIRMISYNMKERMAVRPALRIKL